MNKRGKTFIISGPSGVGKSTVLHALFEGRDDLYFSVSATTRAPREGERDGVDYHFIHADRFREMIEGDAFLEYAEYVGNFYGTPKKYVDYNYFVINDTVEQAVEELRAILCAEHCKPAERMEYILNGKEM